MGHPPDIRYFPMLNSVDSVHSLEEYVINRLRALVDGLPVGRAELSVGRERSYLTFRIKPANARSAGIQGTVVDQQGIDFTIGQATGGEIYVGSENGGKGETRGEKFFQVCQAVFTSHFVEVLTYSSRKTVIRSRIMLNVNGRSVRLGGHQLFWWLVPRKTTKQFSYEPY